MKMNFTQIVGRKQRNHWVHTAAIWAIVWYDLCMAGWPMTVAQIIVTDHIWSLLYGLWLQFNWASDKSRPVPVSTAGPVRGQCATTRSHRAQTTNLLLYGTRGPTFKIQNSDQCLAGSWMREHSDGIRWERETSDQQSPGKGHRWKV